MANTVDKKDVQRILESLPEKFQLDELTRRIHIVKIIYEAIEDVKQGKTTPHSEVLKLAESWK